LTRHPFFTCASHHRSIDVTGGRLDGRMTNEVPESGTPRGISIVPVDHPSLGGDIDRFLAELRAEPRYFGPSAKANPKPFPSLIDAIGGRSGFRLAAIERCRVVGMCRVDDGGELYVAVVADRRGDGVGQFLARAALQRAADLHYPVLTARSTRRSRAMLRLCEQFGCTVIELDRGRTELILTPSVLARTA
jgi:GNAT superfamily N-acetyltransferase